MSLNLGTLNNQYSFNLPSDFVPQELEERYMPLLKALRKPYASVIDYLNSTIQDIDYPELVIPTSTQTIKRGKETFWRGSANVYDGFSRNGQITFMSVDSNLNYIIIQNCLTTSYLNVNQTYDGNLVLAVVDQNRKAFFITQFRSLIFTKLDGTKFAYNDQTVNNKTFQMSFVYNYIDIEYVKDRIETVRNSTVGKIIPNEGQQNI